VKKPFVLSAAALAGLSFLVSSSLSAEPGGKAEHIVVVVWDGMRPDFITPQCTPSLYELAQKGSFFLRHHSAYITSTEVNGTALATGMHPEHSGVMANVQYRPDLNWLTSYGTEALDAVRRGDLATDGKYLEVPTVAEMVHRAGFPTIIAGSKPIALLHDRAAKRESAAAKESVTLFRGQTIPRSVLETLTRSHEIGPFTTNSPAFRSWTNAAPATNEFPGFRRGGSAAGGESSNNVDSWTTKALTRGLWRKGLPKYSLLWLSEPDGAQHAYAPGSENALAALESSDKNLAAVLKALEEKDLLGKTDIFIVSDHGFSSVSRGVEVIEALKRAKFVAGRQFENPEAGDIMVVNLGGSLSFYVFDHHEPTIRRLIQYLQGTDYAGVIFSSLKIEGTFEMAQAHINVSRGAPDVLVSLRWSDEKSEFGVPGTILAMDGKHGTGVHASLSRFDLHNTLVAAGPDFKSGFVSELPSGNIDLAPTILHLLGIQPDQEMDGRVLFEALNQPGRPDLKAAEETLEASRPIGFLTWRQSLKIVKVGYSTYYEEGNGECRLKQTHDCVVFH
jgi:arylsulfatase A-like enzyme